MRMFSKRIKPMYSKKFILSIHFKMKPIDRKEYIQIGTGKARL